MRVLFPSVKSPFVYTSPSLPTLPFNVNWFWKFSTVLEKIALLNPE